MRPGRQTPPATETWPLVLPAGADVAARELATSLAAWTWALARVLAQSADAGDVIVSGAESRSPLKMVVSTAREPLAPISRCVPPVSAKMWAGRRWWPVHPVTRGALSQSDSEGSALRGCRRTPHQAASSRRCAAEPWPAIPRSAREAGSIR